MDIVAADPAETEKVAGQYEQLFRAEFTRMVGLARLLGADDPENIAQEAFVRLHDRFRGLRNEGSARAYLSSTVVNLTRTRITHLVMARRSVARYPPLAPAHEDGSDMRAESASLRLALAQLSPRHREAVILRFWMNFSMQDIARAMGTRVGTAKSQVSRGLSALREILDDAGEAR